MAKVVALGLAKEEDTRREAKRREDERRVCEDEIGRDGLIDCGCSLLMEAG